MMNGILLGTDRFTLRPLQIEDANERYLSWFSDSGASRIAAQKTTRSLADLQGYIADRIGRPDVVFLGIFERATQRHIGNIKFEPVDRQGGYAVFGILIGDAAFRGKGVAAEVIAATGLWLKGQGVREIVLGVDIDNASAIRAYEKAGFHVGETPHIPALAGIHRMILTL